MYTVDLITKLLYVRVNCYIACNLVHLTRVFVNILGGFTHKDSAGNTGNLHPGWVQWMTAGSGVVHSEMPSQELLENGGRSEGFQLWVNLPKKDKMIKPRYQDTPPEKIPVVKSPGNLFFAFFGYIVEVEQSHRTIQGQ